MSKRKKKSDKKPAPAPTTITVEVEIVPASGSPSTRRVDVATETTVHDVLVAAKAAFQKCNVFLSDVPVGEGALKTTHVVAGAKLRVIERPAGS